MLTVLMPAETEVFRLAALMELQRTLYLAKAKTLAPERPPHLQTAGRT